MEFHLLLTFSLLSVLFAATTDASLPAEDYWKSVLPNTPFPKALESLLQQNARESKEHYIINLDQNDDVEDGFSKEHYIFNLDHKDDAKDGFSKKHYIFNLDHKDDAKDGFSKEHYIISLDHKDDAKDGFSKEHYIISLDYKDDQNTFMDNGKEDAKDGLSKEHYIISLDHKDDAKKDLSKEHYIISLDHKDDAKKDLSKEHYIISLDQKDDQSIFMTNRKDVAKSGLSKENDIINLDIKDSKNTFSNDDIVINRWMDAAKGDFSYVAAFYSPGDLYPGRRMKLHFRNVGSKVGFLPREIAKSIPFSSADIPKILDHFAIKAGSAEANSIADVIDLCEGPKMEGEEKLCPTSLESMIDFAVTRLGQIGMVLTTQPGKKQEYIVLKEAKKMGDKPLVCHKNVYPYALYYCHEMQGTKAYSVPLLGADGTRINVVTVCHEETSAWNPKELAFQLLKAKPGMTICHFLANDIIVWVPAKDPGNKLVTHPSMPIMDQ